MTLKISFSKIQGCGNDFVVCSKADLNSEHHNDSLIRSICDRHLGIGADGLMVVDSSASPIDVLMYNPDGSPMGMCGNGIRCVVRYLYTASPDIGSSDTGSSDKGSPYSGTALNDGIEVIDFVVFGRKIRCRTRDRGLTTEVEMGAPSFDPIRIPINSDSEFFGRELLIEGKSFSGWALSMGNPHFVTFVDQIDPQIIAQFGPKIENHHLFPERTNVEFVKVMDRGRIEVMVWERGAGLTLACGSGACAAVVAGIKSGFLDSQCEVLLPGGNLQIRWDCSQDNASVFLTGPAKEVFRGVGTF